MAASPTLAFHTDCQGMRATITLVDQEAPPGSHKKRGGGGGSGTQQFVYQKWPDQIFPIVNLAVSH